MVGGAPSTHYGPSGHRYRTGTIAAALDDDRAAATATHERLHRHSRNGGYLVMTVPPRWQERATTQLASYGATVVDLDEWIIGSLRRLAAVRNIEWERAIVATDATGPTGDRWARLRTVMADAIAPLTTELLATEHVLLTHPGLLARFDRLGLLDELRSRTRLQHDGQVLRTLWVLVPSDDPAATPKLAGKPIPVTTGAEHLALPDPWLENLHHITVKGETA
jgi:hypothetical protein